MILTIIERVYKYFEAKLLRLSENLIFSLFLLYWRYYFIKKNKKDITRKPRLFWGPVPILNFKYWSAAMQEAGFESTTLTSFENFIINDKKDFDVYLYEKFPKKKGSVAELLRRLRMTKYIAANFDIIHTPCIGISIADSQWLYEEEALFERFYNKEAYLYHLAGCKIISLPYGMDIYMYSKVNDNSFKHALQASYPGIALVEDKISARINYWQKNADAFLCGFMFDGIGRWDVTIMNVLSIDLSMWKMKEKYNMNDGYSGYVNVIHTPNHRGFKGTEFIIHAVKELQEEGLKVNLILIEKKKNEEVRRIMQEEADILAEQLICTGYGLSAVEGMATGLPVLSNLDNDHYTRVLRRYAQLNECPILSATPESVKNNLKELIINPELRKELGRAGRAYVEKYHSYKNAQFLFGKIYEKIWYGNPVDLINLYHPLKEDSFNNLSPKVRHPLIENKLPADYLRKISYENMH